MKKIFLCVIASALFVIHCKAPTSKQEVKQEKEPIIVKSLLDFFKRAEIDIASAGGVVVDRDLIKNLSHLQFMNGGGRKYYLLERDNISEMIRAVTIGVYHDFILINNDGKIIYTMRNNDIFGQNVRTSLRDTSIGRCFANRDRRIYFEDVSGISEISGDYYIFVSSEVKGKNSFPGIFILQIEIAKLLELLDKNTCIVNNDGIYKINSRSELINKPHELKDRVTPYLMEDFKERTLNIGSRYISCRPFKFENISWFILTDKEGANN